nr:putative integron gene cassette protein [uncultured bacterium]
MSKMSRTFSTIQHFLIASFIGGIFILFLPIIVVFLVIMGLVSLFIKEDKRFTEEYGDFIKEHEGAEFFCYTNRKNSKHFVEKYILSALEPKINVIYLEGKKPQSQFNEQVISHMLYNINQIGFPNVMKIKEGQVVDLSLHKELYNTINQKRSPDIFLSILNEKLKNLKTVDPVQLQNWSLSKWVYPWRGA